MSDGVDMVNLDMQIVGDPAWIPTSDAYWQDKVRKGEQYAQAFMPDGTINYNLSPPFVQVNLKTPIDYDDTSGLQNPNQAINSSFSGVYRITQVDSTFSGGAFQQRLTGLRAPMQSVAGGVARDPKQNETAERNAVIDDLSDNALSYLQKQAKDYKMKDVRVKIPHPDDSIPLGLNDYDETDTFT